MLTKADDFPIHQTPEPIAYAGTDRNFYDRYFFNGYTMDGSQFFAAAMGIYPHLNIIDASFCVVLDGVQHNLHASRILGMERMDTSVGPIVIDVIAPLQSLRVRVSDNEHGITADIVFHARCPAIEEPRFIYRSGPRTIMDYTRLTQNGSYEGWIAVKGKRIEITRSSFLGTRDRSWGVRPVGAADSQAVAPPPPPQFYWLWAPCNFEDRISLYHINAEASGKPWNTRAVLCETGAAGPVEIDHCRSDIVFKSGTRHARAASVVMTDPQGGEWRADFAPQWNFYMSGLGYLSANWGHGHYKGPLAIGYEAFELAKVNENDLHFLHVQAFSKVTLTGPNGLRREGAGVLEQLIIGPHAPSGFTSILDTAP
ncbi:MAG: hypothetical protein HXY22_06465 [Alphaproteobacteria bacterium]|nr:hypothetical protein [Alphaproteobacteria bacterium]